MRLACLILACLLSPPALAHDFWIESSPGAVGQPVTARLKIGPDFVGEDEYPFNPLHIVRFVRVGPDGQARRFAGFTGATPAGRFTPKAPGRYVLAYQSGPSQITLEAAKFEEYLREEGLTHVLDWRKTKGEHAAPGKERFYRNAKALLQVGQGTGPFDRALGLPFELVALTDPCAGGTISFQALVNGQPAPNVRVAAYRGPKAAPVEGRTDAQGKIALRIDTPGRWLVKSVHAQRQTGAVDWRSDWASLTFIVER